MEIMKNVQMFVLATVALAIGSQKAEAQWTVFDPATYGEVGAVWSENVSMNVKLDLTLVQITNILKQATKIYGLAEQESTFLSKGQIRQAVGFFAQVADIPGHDSWNKVMREAGSLANADSAWQEMANPNMAARNRIAMADSFAASALQSLGNCNSAATTNGNNLGGLEAMILSGEPGANTAANQRNLANLSASQQIRYLQCQENLDEQRTKLELLRAHEARDRDQSVINTNTAIDNYNASAGGEYNTSPDESWRRQGMH
jgi:hypothetical protein